VNIEGGSGVSYFNGGGNVGIKTTTPTQALDVQGSINVLNTLVMSNSFLRNVLINGAFNVAQRGGSFTDGNGYTLDRWYGNRNGGVAGVTYSQVYGAFGANKYCMSIQRTAGNSSTAAANLFQAIEGQNCRFMAGQVITLSFQIGTGGTISATTHTVQLNYQTTTTDIGPTGSWTAVGSNSFTVVNNTAFTKYNMQWTVPSNATQLEIIFGINFSGTAGADDRYYLTEVQLEAGPVPTPFERKLLDQTIIDCQRYYQKSYDIGTAPGTATTQNLVGNSQSGAGGQGNFAGEIYFPVIMRAVPSISYWDGAGNASKCSRLATAGGTTWTNNATANVAPFNIGTNGFLWYGDNSVANFSCFIHYTANAELT